MGPAAVALEPGGQPEAILGGGTTYEVTPVHAARAPTAISGDYVERTISLTHGLLLGIGYWADPAAPP